jgi:iron complex transport system permease protein
MSFLRTNSGRFTVLVMLFGLLLTVVLISLRFGSLELSYREILHALFFENSGINYQIICNIRLPRVLLGALVGSSLAVSGAILQGIMRNALASPGIIGVSAGGGLAGIVVMLILPQFGTLLIPAAFCGSLGTALLVYLLSWKRGISPVRLILAGVAVSTMLGAFSSTILLLNAEKAGGVLDFAIGSLAARSWQQIFQAGPYMAIGLCMALFLSHRLNILSLGDEVATGLGIRVERTRLLLIATAALLASAAVSVAG